MKKIFAAFIFCASIAFPLPTMAEPEIPAGQNSDADKPIVMQFGNYFMPVAKTFGCDKFGWASFVQNHNLISLEYVPNSDDVSNWMRLMTVTVYPLPQQSDAQKDVMQKIETHLLGIGAKGKIISQENYTDSNGDIRLFIEYEIGEGIQKEHNAGVFLRSGATSAAFVQIQSRGKPFDEKDSAKMKAYAQNKLQTVTNN